MPPAVVLARILVAEDHRDAVQARERGELGATLFLRDDDDRRGVVPRPTSVASEIETLAAALTGRRGVSESVLGGADLLGAVGMP
jgi:hypothetical protein